MSLFEFSYADEQGNPKWLSFPCQGNAPKTKCSIALRPSQTNYVGASWQWDGHREAPTITPSINCEQICGWHGWLEQGKFRKA